MSRIWQYKKNLHNNKCPIIFLIILMKSYIYIPLFFELLIQNINS